MLATTLVGIVALLVAGELLARVLVPEWTPTRAERAVFWQYNDLLGWAHRADQRGRFVHPDFDVDVSINSLGLRDDEYPLERTERKRMLVLGDSFGWGFGVEHHERFSEILERRHPHWEIINASVSGYGTDQQLLYLREQGLRFRPEVVLLLFSNNDFSENTSAEEYWYEKPYFVLHGDELVLRNDPVPRSTPRQKLKRFLRGRTFLLARIYDVTVGLLPEGPDDDDDEPETDRYALTDRLLGEMHERSFEAGARFVLVAGDLGPKRHRALSRLSIDREIAFLPLGPFLRREQRELTFPHDYHWNPEGHRVVADLVESFLLERGIL